MVRLVNRRLFQIVARTVTARDHGEPATGGGDSYTRAERPRAESLSGHAENKERAALVKVYERRVAAGLGIFETPPATERFSESDMKAVYAALGGES
jgi:hypothetical protein